MQNSHMNKVTILSILSVIAVISFTIAYISLNYFEQQEPKEKLFGELTCEEIRKLNIIGLKVANNDTTYSQERIFECLKEVIIK